MQFILKLCENHIFILHHALLVKCFGTKGKIDNYLDIFCVKLQKPLQKILGDMKTFKIFLCFGISLLAGLEDWLLFCCQIQTPKTG